MAKRKGKGYWFGTDWVVSLIISIIPGLNWWMGVVHRFMKKNYLGMVVYIFFGAVLGFLDFVTILLGNEITFLA